MWVLFWLIGASLVAQLVNNPPAMWETWVQSLGWEDPLEKGTATHSSYWPGEFHGLYGPWGCKESGLPERLSLWLNRIVPSPCTSFSCHRIVSKGYLFLPFYPLLSQKQYLSRSVAKLCLTPCGPMNCSTPSFPVLHHLPEFAQIHLHWVTDAIQPSHPLLLPFPPALNLSHHQGLFQWVGSLYQVAKLLELQLQHQSFQWILRVDFP